MTLFEFQQLTDEEKIELLYEQAVYIGKRRHGYENVLLYQLESFYTEVYYRKHRCYFTRIFCFNSTGFLDPYLEQIDVEHLVM